MAEFYDHAGTGKLHFKSIAGGGTGIWDAPATAADIKAYYQEHQVYLAGKLAQKTHAEAVTEKETAIAEIKAEAETLSAATEQL